MLNASGNVKELLACRCRLACRFWRTRKLRAVTNLLPEVPSSGLPLEAHQALPSEVPSSDLPLEAHQALLLEVPSSDLPLEAHQALLLEV